MTMGEWSARRWLLGLGAVAAFVASWAAVASMPCEAGTDHVGVVVSRDDADREGFQWPLTVDAVSVECAPGHQLRALPLDGGVTYALNGLAKKDGYAAIDPIWLHGANSSGSKAEMSDLIEYADLLTCSGGPP